MLPLRARCLPASCGLLSCSAAAAAAGPGAWLRRCVSSSSSTSKDETAQRLLATRTSTRRAADSMDIWQIMPSKAAARRSGVDVHALPQPSSLAHIVKRPVDSRLTVLLPFGSDPELRAANVNRWGQLRVGKLLEEIDAFAGTIAYAHCDDDDVSSGPVTLVTVSLDRLDLLSYPLRADVDYKMTGCVTYAGTSSLNIDIDLVALPPPGSGGDLPVVPVMQASMTFVARSRDNRPLPVPRLVPVTDAERRLAEAGRLATEARKAARKQSLLRQPPTAGELALVHALFMEREGTAAASSSSSSSSSSCAPSSSPPAASCSVFGDETDVTTTVLTMPQDRNLHGKVFGGFLMRKAFETAFACGWRLTGTLPKFLALDDVSFLHPVDTGTLLRFDARCTYARGGPLSKTYSVSVSAHMETPTKGMGQGRQLGAGAEARGGSTAASSSSSSSGAAATRLTNEFNFVFHCDDPSSIPRVYPRSYADAMEYIAAHRRVVVGESLAEGRRRADKARGAASLLRFS
jgi:acyl-coenzyme A thioesterase 9